MRQALLFYFVLSNLSAQVTPAPMSSVSLKTAGWCSPAVAHVIGNVTIICNGVSPKALERLNRELAKQNLTLEQKVQEANDWAAKYKNVEERLKQAGEEFTLSRQAAQSIQEGDLDKAEILLKQILERQEQQTAANQFNLGRVYELRFEPVKALPFYQKAYSNRPEEFDYAFSYAVLLSKQNQFREAEPIYLAVLQRIRQLAKAKSQIYVSFVAVTLTNLGNLYSLTHQLRESDNAYTEALQIYRELVKANPQAYLPSLAMTLNNLGVLYRSTQRLKEADTALTEALQIGRELAKTNPEVALPFVAGALNNLGSLYSSDAHQLKKAAKAYTDALHIYRELVKANLLAYQADVAQLLNNIGNLYSNSQQLTEAADAYTEALQIYRALVQVNPQAYRPDLAQTFEVTPKIRIP